MTKDSIFKLIKIHFFSESFGKVAISVNRTWYDPIFINCAYIDVPMVLFFLPKNTSMKQNKTFKKRLY